MIKKDYILKIVEQLAKLIKIIIELKAKNKPIEVYLDRVYDDILKIDRQKINELSPQDIILYLEKIGTNKIFWDFLVDLILLDESYKDRTDEQINKALYILNHLEHNYDKISLTRRTKIEHLENKLLQN